MSTITDLLRGAGQAAGVAGQFVEGYGKDQSIGAARLLAQAKADEEARRNAVLNRVALAGIDPALQGQIAGSKARGETGALVDRARQMAPIETDKAVDTATRLSPITTQTAVNTATQTAPITEGTHQKERLFDNAHQAPDKPMVSVQQPLRPGDPAQAVVIDPTDPAHPKVSATPIPGVSKTGGTAGGGAAGVRGLGPGGVFGAGSGLGSVKEMQAANPNLKQYEQGFLGNAPASDLSALDRFRQRLANDLQTHGFISAATASEAERELAATNPDLAIYGRNLKQWVVSDMNLSRGGTDERAKMDQAVSGLSIPLSSMPPAQRATFLHQMWEARDARLEGLVQSATAAKAILDRVSGSAGVNAPPASPAQGGSRAQQLWDQAVAKHGQAKVLQEFGPRPPA